MAEYFSPDTRTQITSPVGRGIHGTDADISVLSTSETGGVCTLRIRNYDYATETTETITTQNLSGGYLRRDTTTGFSYIRDNQVIWSINAKADSPTFSINTIHIPANQPIPQDTISQDSADPNNWTIHHYVHDGAQGPQGPRGATGATGPQGLTGPQGPAGINGKDGSIKVDKYTDWFTFDGVNYQFALPVPASAISSETQIQILVAGLILDEDSDYTLNATKTAITFSSTFPTGTLGTVIYYQPASNVVIEPPVLYSCAYDDQAHILYLSGEAFGGMDNSQVEIYNLQTQTLSAYNWNTIEDTEDYGTIKVTLKPGYYWARIRRYTAGNNYFSNNFFFSLSAVQISYPTLTRFYYDANTQTCTLQGTNFITNAGEIDSVVMQRNTGSVTTIRRGSFLNLSDGEVSFTMNLGASWLGNAYVTVGSIKSNVISAGFANTNNLPEITKATYDIPTGTITMSGHRMVWNDVPGTYSIVNVRTGAIVTGWTVLSQTSTSAIIQGLSLGNDTYHISIQTSQGTSNLYVLTVDNLDHMQFWMANHNYYQGDMVLLNTTVVATDVQVLNTIAICGTSHKSNTTFDTAELSYWSLTDAGAIQAKSVSTTSTLQVSGTDITTSSKTINTRANSDGYGSKLRGAGYGFTLPDLSSEAAVSLTITIPKVSKLFQTNIYNSTLEVDGDIIIGTQKLTGLSLASTPILGTDATLTMEVRGFLLNAVTAGNYNIFFDITMLASTGFNMFSLDVPANAVMFMEKRTDAANTTANTKTTIYNTSTNYDTSTTEPQTRFAKGI